MVPNNALALSIRAESRGVARDGSDTAYLLGNSAISSHLRDLGYSPKSLNSFLKCGQPNGEYVEEECKCGQFMRQLTWKCNLRVCPVCSLRRKRRVRGDFLPVLRKYKPNRRDFYYFLTINPENYDNISEGIDHLRKSFSKLIRLKYFKERFKGGLYCIEATNNGMGWNFHIHAIIYGRFIDNRPVSGQDSLVVSLCNRSFTRRCNVYITALTSPLHSMNYLLKYISSSKEGFQTPRMMAQYITVIHKRKLITSFGLFFDDKPLKQTKPVCRVCGFEIIFCYELDREVVSHLRTCVKPPDETFK